jgi:hypothetical protein
MSKLSVYLRNSKINTISRNMCKFLKKYKKRVYCMHYHEKKKELLLSELGLQVSLLSKNSTKAGFLI